MFSLMPAGVTTTLTDSVNIMVQEPFLQIAKVADDTLVLFISDNGIPFPGAKTTLYDAGVRLPMIAKRPGQNPGVVSEAMVSWTDLCPTILDTFGVKKE